MEPTVENTFAFFDEINVNLTISFFNYAQHKITEDIEHAADTNPQAANALAHIRRQTTVSCFLLLYAHVEEMLYHLWKIKIKSSPPAGSGLNRHRDLFKQLEIDLSTASFWRDLNNAEKIRHCLLHANGRPDLMKHPEAADQVVQHLSPNITTKNHRLTIEPAYLDQFAETVRTTREALLAATNKPQSQHL